MQFIDTHVHLEDSQFDPDRNRVIQAAQQAGVRRMLNVGSTILANQHMLDVIKAGPEIFGAFGLHPHEFPETSLAEVRKLPELLCQEKVVAVGEIGLDFHLFPGVPTPDHAAQQQGFSTQLKLAQLFELPVVIHVREAYPEALELIRSLGGLPRGGVMHCYSGGLAYLAEVLSLGLMVGIGGTVTYPKAEELREVVRRVPVERILLETDAPYLPPQRYRGKRNEPLYLTEVAAKVAEIRGMSLERLAEQTSRNADQLFKIAESHPGVFTYELSGHLYINLSNRCSAHCGFCPRQVHRKVQQHELTLQREPRAGEIITAIGDPKKYKEVVFCGFGEPLLRLPTLLEVSREVKRRGGRIRVNTNGQGDTIYGRDILPQCQGLVDCWSISLNSTDPDQYFKLVRPAGGPQTQRQVLDFIRRAVSGGFEVIVTAVELPDVNGAAIRQLAEQLGAHYRGRKPERLGEPEK